MNEMKRDMIRIQELVGSAFGQTGALVALSDGGHMNPKKLQKTLEQTMEHFESAALELRRLCEQYSPGTGGFSKKSVLPAMDVTGSVEEFGYGWLHITLNTLLPHCRYQNPNWLADTISRLLDGYVACGKELPFYRRALLVIDEHTTISRYRDAGDAKVYTVTEKVLTKLFDRKPSIYTPPRTPYLTGKGDVIDAPLIKTAGKTGGSHRK